MFIYLKNIIKIFISSIKFFFQLCSGYKVFLLFLFSLLIVLFETFTLSLVFNASNIILNDNFETANYFLKFINSFIKVESSNLPLIIILILLLFIFLKNIFLIFIIIYKNNFFLGMHSDISKKIYRKYLYQNYNFFINNNSSDLISSVLQDVNISMKSFEAIFNIFTECILISIFFCYLLYLDIYMALIFLVGSALFFIFYLFFTKKKLVSLSKQRLILNETILRDLQQSYSSFREVIVFSIREIFIKSINKKFKDFFINIKITSILQQATRIAIEQVFVILIIIAALINLYIFSKNINDIISIFVVYFFAFFRLLPSLNKLIIETQTYIYGKLFINKIKDIFKLEEEAHEADYSNNKNIFNNEIEFSNVNYDHNDVSIFNNLNIKIIKNQKIGILGESGSGKTTFLNLLMGLLKPKTGKIKIDSINMRNVNTAWLSLIGYVPQNVTILDDTIKKNITFQDNDENIDAKLLDDAINISGLVNVIKKNKLGLDSVIGEKGSKISGGEILRIGLARALYSRAEIFILDEFTSALDERKENEIITSIKDIKKTFIIVSHKKNTLKNCDKIYVLKNKQLLEI